MERFAADDDPVTVVASAFDMALGELVEKLRRFDAIRLIEVARMAFLPMAVDGEMPTTAEAGAAHVEALSLIALSARQKDAAAGVAGSDSVEAQEMSAFISEAKEELVALLYLAHMRSVVNADHDDKLAMVALLIQGAEIWMRNSSYPEMVEATNLALLDGEPVVREALNAELGFDATDALAVLNACHRLQEVGMNRRMGSYAEAMDRAMASMADGGPDPELVEFYRSRFNALFEPEADEATVAIEAVIAETGIPADRVRAVVERFRLDLGTAAPTEVVDEFAIGRNPMRARPLIVSGDGRMMLPHHALNAAAVRYNLEEHLKTSKVWDRYGKYRGDLLESRTRAALARVLPGADYRDGFEYFAPANDAEETAADPAKYTKKAECDHLVLLDDVAIIVEDKAVALSALSRGGKIKRIRTDLTGIITKAADQAGRLRDGIERDGGLRIKGEGWVDLSHIREIHTIAVSLDDISTVLAATAELLKARVLSLDNIPWTVSLHDLELITEVVARPAEFLLYLRRRREPDVTVMFRAADELDLFLYFYETGLWVEPDPNLVRAAYPFLPEPTTAQLRRYREQMPAILTSRTDPLDQWYYMKDRPDADAETAPKPAMVTSPVAPLIDELQSRNVTGWLSIGATLLAGDTRTQSQFSRNADDLLDNPSPQGVGRSLTTPITSSIDPAEGWLFVWVTRPPGETAAHAEKRVRDYLRAKKHQLKIPRGAAFLYDEVTRDLVDAFYDGHIGPLDGGLTETLRSLQPASSLQNRLHPNANRPPLGGKSGQRPKAKQKRRR